MTIESLGAGVYTRVSESEARGVLARFEGADYEEEIMATEEDVADRFQSPAGSAITLNLGKVEQYGLDLNEDALDSVNHLIQ